MNKSARSNQRRTHYCIFQHHVQVFVSCTYSTKWQSRRQERCSCYIHPRIFRRYQEAEDWRTLKEIHLIVLVSVIKLMAKNLYHGVASRFGINNIVISHLSHAYEYSEDIEEDQYNIKANKQPKDDFWNHRNGEEAEASVSWQTGTKELFAALFIGEPFSCHFADAVNPTRCA